jgi:hypothetical protein
LGSGFSIIICPNLREFEQIIVRDHLWNSPDQIKIRLSNYLFGQVHFISDLSQSPKIQANNYKGS